jgi:hypothetical protein
VGVNDTHGYFRLVWYVYTTPETRPGALLQLALQYHTNLGVERIVLFTRSRNHGQVSE